MQKGKKNVLMLRSRDTTYDPRVNIEKETLIKNGYKVFVVEWDRKNTGPGVTNEGNSKRFYVKNTMIMKIIPYDIFKMRLWWREGFKTAEKIYKKYGFDTVHCHDLDTLPIGVRLKKKYGINLIYDAAEVWTYMIEQDVPKFIVNRFKKIEKKCMNDIDALITVDTGYAKYFESIGYPLEDIKIVKNAKKRVLTEYIPSKNKIPVVVYLGGFRKNRNLPQLLAAAQNRNDIRVLLGGSGPLYNDLKEKYEKEKNIKFLGMVPMEKVMDITLKSDVVYCVFDPGHPLTRIGSPNKFFEALAVGRPLIVSKGTYVGSLVEKLDCGIVTTPDVKGVKKALNFIVKHPDKMVEMGKNALSAFFREYNWEEQEKVLMSVYNRLLN